MKFSRLLLFVLALAGCREAAKEKKDLHSYAEEGGALTGHLELSLNVDFSKKILYGTAGYEIKNPSGSSQIVFDTRGLEIEKIEDGSNKLVKFRLGKEDELLGSSLEVDISPETVFLTIHYRTIPGAEALQWLNPSQTAGKKSPFMFTQSQAILARTWIPCQDSPGIRFTYNARITVPKGMMALMSAENPQSINDSGVYVFRQSKPIPAYLMALAAGDIRFRPVGERTGVYAEPEVIGKAHYEFAEMESMLEAAEKLYGPYRWGRYDLLVLPPSFPFGGMENPCLTFATPTVIAGDRSLTSLVAHELAHSWSGNLVTNLSWDDFWLNEGFTVYFERRIMEKVYGSSYSDMLSVLGYAELSSTLSGLGKENPDTRLKLDLKGRNPDDAVSDIAYEKGFLFLKHLEIAIGRERFDSFLKEYFTAHSFQSMDTEGFLEYLRKELDIGKEKYAMLKIDEWVYGTGLPDNCPLIGSDRLEKAETAAASIKAGKLPEASATKEWTSHEWLHFVRNLPEDIHAGHMADLDKEYHFTETGNSEVLDAWLILAIRKGYKPAYPALESFLMNVGRRRFLTPLYKELIKTEEGKRYALNIYRKARPNYHFVAVSTLDELLGWESLKS